MVWGLFPGVYKNVSWESHMLGFFSGVVLAIWFRKEGPQAPVYQWLEDEEGESGEIGEGETEGLSEEETEGQEISK